MQSKEKLFFTWGNIFLLFSDSTVLVINPRTYMQIHTPTVVQGSGVDGPPPRVFDMLQYFETILPSVESLWYSLQDKVYFMGVGAVGGPVTSPKMVTILVFTKN